jgi:N-acetylneuraminate synthase
MFKSFQGVFVIAEVAESHYGEFDRAVEMIKLAKKSGCSAVKFQHHLPSEEMLPDVPMSKNMKEPLFDFLTRTALGIENHIKLKKFCDEIGIIYLCTPFSRQAAEELEEFVKPVAYKIGSGEMTNHPMLLAISKFNKPMIVSTGMSEIWEIKETYDLLIDKVPELILTNCTSAYPPNEGDVNLGFIPEMIKIFPKSIIGHSDHTNNIYTSIGAVALGARVIEKHVTIDETLIGPDQDVSISFSQLTDLVTAVKYVYKSLGAQKTLLESEREIQAWARHSLVYLCDLKSKSVIEPGSIWSKRPGTGVPAKRLQEFIGKKLTRDVKANTLLSEQDFQV